MPKKSVLNEDDIKSVLEFANNNMRIVPTARAIFMHPNTLCHKLEKVERLTGLNPYVFADLVMLVEKFKKGKGSKWKIHSDGYYPYCPNCGKEPPGRVMTDYCPNCGEDMRE